MFGSIFSWLRPPDEVEAAYPALRDETIYAVGDVHGRDDLLEDVHRKIDADMAERGADGATEIYLGDYVDRGPASSEVIGRLVARGWSRDAVFLRGNHDAAVLEFLDGAVPFDVWKSFGGEALQLRDVCKLARRAVGLRWVEGELSLEPHGAADERGELTDRHLFA